MGSTQKPLERPYVYSLHLAAFDAAHEAQPALPFVHLAGTRTHVALNATVSSAWKY